MKKLLASLLATTLAAITVATPLGESISYKLLNGSISASAGGNTEFEYYNDFQYYNNDGIVISEYVGDSENVVIPSEINGKEVTCIGYHAFFDCSNLTSVTIPNSVKTIERCAFEYCEKLTSITIPSSVTNIGSEAFSNTPILDNQTSNVKYVDNWAVECDSNTMSVSIESGTVGIADEAFAYCDSLTSVIIPNGVTIIGNGAFACSPITNITIPNSVKKIGGAAFNGTKWLENKQQENPLVIVNGILIDGTICHGKITIPNSVKMIGEMAFAENTDLTGVTIPNSVTSIGRQAFFCCSNLTSLTIPDSVSEIGNYAFSSTGITSIVIPDSVITNIDEWSNTGVYTEGWFTDCEKLANVKLSENMDYIPPYIFSGCANLKNVTIPNGIENIGGNSFSDCTSFTSIIIPNTVTDISHHAFYNCSNLSSVTLSNNVEYIDTCAFMNCGKLKEVTIPKSATFLADAFGYIINYNETIDDMETIKVDGFKIKCYKDTAGEKYAKDNGFDYELLDAPAHTHSYTSKITKRPTCTATGVKTYTCSCGDSYIETIAKTAHKYTSTVVKPTYYAQGYTLHKCSACGNSYKDNYKAKLTLANISKVNFTSSENAVKMSYSKVLGATGYKVYKYNTSTKKWQGVANTKNTSYTFNKLKSGTTYKFTVRAYKTEGEKTCLSPKYSTFTTSTNPAKVNFTLKADTKKATVKWSKVTGASGYKVYYKTSKNGSWKLIKTANNKTTSYTKSGLTKGKSYYFTVKAYRTVGGKTYNGSYTTKKCVATNSGWITVKGNKYYFNSNGQKLTGYKKVGNCYYFFASNGIMQTGWQKVNKAYYFFNRINGKQARNTTVDGIAIDKNGKAKNSSYNTNKIETMMRAHKIMLNVTKPTDSMEQKRLKCFNWVLSLPYHRFRLLKPIYNNKGWEMTFANDIFIFKSGDCVSEASAVAFLFKEIGYENVYVCHDTGHAWVMVGKKLFDPVFAEGKNFKSNYNVTPYDYRVNPVGKRKI